MKYTDHHITAFILNHEIYQLSWMLLGLCNAPGSFQRTMYVILILNNLKFPFGIFGQHHYFFTQRKITHRAGSHGIVAAAQIGVTWSFEKMEARFGPDWRLETRDTNWSVGTWFLHHVRQMQHKTTSNSNGAKLIFGLCNVCRRLFPAVHDLLAHLTSSWKGGTYTVRPFLDWGNGIFSNITVEPNGRRSTGTALQWSPCQARNWRVGQTNWLWANAKWSW